LVRGRLSWCLPFIPVCVRVLHRRRTLCPDLLPRPEPGARCGPDHRNDRGGNPGPADPAWPSPGHREQPTVRRCSSTAAANGPTSATTACCHQPPTIRPPVHRSGCCCYPIPAGYRRCVDCRAAVREGDRRSGRQQRYRSLDPRGNRLPVSGGWTRSRVIFYVTCDAMKSDDGMNPTRARRSPLLCQSGTRSKSFARANRTNPPRTDLVRTAVAPISR